MTLANDLKVFNFRWQSGVQFWVAVHINGRLTSLKSPLYKPKYLLIFNKGSYVIELLSGHNRWGVDVVEEIQKRGGILHEGADSYVTEIHGKEEFIVFALEYCSALPAGNNAWQRSGRALSSVLAGVPYLYYAEIGGVELDENRKIKAPRFPNPVVPFSYVATTKRYNICCVPIYKTHPSITEQLFNTFKNIIGIEQSQRVIRGLIEGEDVSKHLTAINDKALELVKLLSNNRRSIDTLRNNQWDQLLAAERPEEWLANNTPNLTWQKKIADKVLVSLSFRKLISSVIGLCCKTIGGRDLPICLIPVDRLTEFETILQSLYPRLNILIDKTKPLTIVWITGFKPKGDDSRPDRGLAPLARMIIGGQSNMMCVISGPAKKSTWDKLNSSFNDLCNENGLWLAVFKLSNYILIDSATIDSPRFFNRPVDLKRNLIPVKFELAGDPSVYSEDDTDCAIHQLFAHKSMYGILEGMCNPPGGDWSGISCFDLNGEYRWTSLPRVSQIGGKRPDHVIQVAQKNINIFLSIESKGLGRDLEDGIGEHLSDYLRDLFKSPPTAHRQCGGEWRSLGHERPSLEPYRIVSVGAFMYNNTPEMEVHKRRGNLDAILAFQLGEDSIVHVLDRTDDRIVETVIRQAELVMTGFKIQVH